MLVILAIRVFLQYYPLGAQVSRPLESIIQFQITAGAPVLQLHILVL